MAKVAGTRADQVVGASIVVGVQLAAGQIGLLADSLCARVLQVSPGKMGINVRSQMLRGTTNSRKRRQSYRRGERSLGPGSEGSVSVHADGKPVSVTHVVLVQIRVPAAGKMVLLQT